MREDAPPVRQMEHPGSGRRRASAFPKGRQVDPDALAEVRGIVGTEVRRDLLIEYLHAIQDRFGALFPRHLLALAEATRLAPAEVYEVATFYAHFDVCKEDDGPPPPRVTARICDGVSCFLAGGERLRRELAGRLEADARATRAPCMGFCDQAPAAMVGARHIPRATVEAIAEAARSGRVDPIETTGPGFEEYRRAGGYRLVEELRAGTRTAEALIAAVEESALRGMGGAGFKSGLKWRLTRAQPAPRYVAINADEGEPGTFKDRHHLETDPHRVLEGTLLAARAIEASGIYFYLRDEYPHIRARLLRELESLRASGLTDGIDFQLRRGAGAYICGEESAMLESIEGKRGYPRHKPPYPVEVGLFGRPTLIHNVETVYWLRDILERGPAWFRDAGRRGRLGRRTFSVSGRVREPGIKIAEAGITLRELIDEHCGGMLDGHTLKAYLPGGASGGILPASLADVPLDFGTLEEHGCFIGSAAVVVLSDKDSVRDVVTNLLRFFEDESCGQCTPCRVGTEKLVRLTGMDRWNQPLLEELSAAMRDASICGLGQAASNPLRSLFRYFPEEAS